MLNSRTLASRLAPCLRAAETGNALFSTSFSRLARTAPKATISSPTIPYNITLSTSGNLPVYLDKSHQGFKVRTIVRKLDGDGEALKEELRAHLNLKEKDQIRWNHYTQQVIIKGKHKEVVEAFLAEKFKGIYKKPAIRSRRNAAADAAAKVGKMEEKAEEKLAEQLV